MVENPLISVVVITYNSANLVIETLNSIAEQSYQNIELIISDDCSKDKTVDVCRHWADGNVHRFVNIEIVTPPTNSGIPANCNRGIKKAKGQWIKLIAGDDILMPDAIRDNVCFVAGKDIKILFSKIRLFKVVENKRIDLSVRPSSNHLIFSKHITARDLYKILLDAYVIPFTPSVFFNASVFDEIGMFDEKYKLMEDYPFWLKATKNDIMLYCMDKITVLYRIHDQSVFNGAKKDSWLISRVYLRDEEFREDYVYPQYSVFGILKSKYKYHISYLLRHAKSNVVTEAIYFLISRALNPFYWITVIARKILHVKYLELRRNL